MRTRVGLALARDAVRAVAIRRRRVVWAAETPLESGTAPDSGIASLLAAAPVPRFPRPTLYAAIGPHASQVRLVAGLPDVQDADTLSAIVRESAASFFLKNGVPLLTTAVHPKGTGLALAAAIDAPAVVTIRDACRALGWRLRMVAPTAVTLANAVTDESFAWSDGSVVVEVTRSGATIESIRTRAACAAEPVAAPLNVVPALAHLGDDAARYADAYGSVQTDVTAPLVLDAVAAGAWTPAEVRKHLTAPSVLLAIALVSAALSPLAASCAARRAQARLAAVGADQWQLVTSALSQLDQITVILEDLRGFADSRVRVTPLLGELARRLPQGSALVSLEISDAQGQVIVLTTNPGAVLSAIERVAGTNAVELLGPSRRETVAGREVQRVTVRWRRGKT